MSKCPQLLIKTYASFVFSFHCTVVDPDPEIRGAGTRSSRPWDKGGGTRSARPWDKVGGRSLKEFFLALRASFLSKNKEGAPPPGPSPGSAPLYVRLWVCYPSSFIEGVCNEYLLKKVIHKGEIDRGFERQRGESPYKTFNEWLLLSRHDRRVEVWIVFTLHHGGRY